MKKIISIVIAIVILSTMLLPMTSLAGNVDDISFVREKNQYFFEDFSAYDGTNMDSANLNNGKNIGYYTRSVAVDGVNVPNVKQYVYDDGNIAVAPYLSGQSFVLVGPRGKSSTAQYNEYDFILDKTNFEDAGNALVLSYDLYVPYSRSNKTTFSAYLAFGYQGKDFNGQSGIAKGPKLVNSSSGQSFTGWNSEQIVDGAQYIVNAQDKGGSTMNISIPNDGGKWFDIETFVVYDDEQKAYVSWNTVDGEPIRCTTGSSEGEIAKLVAKPTDDILPKLKDERRNVWFQFGNGTAEEDGYAIDNIAIKLYNGCKIDNFLSLYPDETTIEIPVYNGYDFSDGAPEEIKRGVFSTEALKADNGVTLTKYAADDKLLLNGEKVTDYSISSNKNVVILNDVAERDPGECMMLEMNGLESADGKVLNNRMFIAPSENFKGIVDKHFFDVSGVEIAVDDINNISPATATIELELIGVSSAVIKNADNTATWTADNGVFDFTSVPLRTNTEYTIYLDGEEYTKFKTVENGSLTFGNFTKSSDAVNVKYTNTFDDDRTVYAIVMNFDENGRYIAGNVAPKTLAGTSSSTVTVDLNSVSGTSYSKVVIVDGLQTLNAFTDVYSTNGNNIVSEKAEASNALESENFDNNGSVVVKGNLGSGETQRVTAVLIDAEGNFVYANDVKSANDGSYIFSIDMTSDIATGTYYLYVAADGKVFENGKEIHYSKDASTAIALVNKAQTKEELADIIKKNQADLEFYYDEYYAHFSESEIVMVASILIGEKEDLKKSNGIGFVTTDKNAATSAFRKAVIVAAVSAGSISSYTEMEAKIQQLGSGILYEWVNENGSKDISSDLKKKWQAGIISRLNGAEFATTSDFINKVYAALLFECIADADGHGNIMDMINDYIDGGYISGLDKKYITPYVCKKLVGNNYTGFEYSILAKDIKKYYADEIADDNTENRPSGGRGGSFTVSGNTLSTPATIDEQNASNEIFNDISDSWAKDIIIELASKKIISGKDNGKFAPSDNITREEFTAIIVRMLGINAKTDASVNFVDVKPGDWYYDSVRIAYQHGIINGISFSEFGAGANISRQDMAVILKNSLDLQEISYEISSSDFDDEEQIAEYAKDAVDVLSSVRVIHGYEDGRFRPNGLATRAEAAKVIYEVMQLLNK